MINRGLPLWLSWWRICLQCERLGFDPWVGNFLQRKGKGTHSSILAWRIPVLWGDSWESLGLQGDPTSPSNEHSGLIPLRIDWFEFLVVQGTFKSLPQHHSLKASILWHSGFLMVQLSHPYMTIGKTTALTIQTFVKKVICLLLIYCLGLSYLSFQEASIF